MAKIYGDYYSISSEFIDIVEMQSFYCREEVSLTQGKTLMEIERIIQKKID